MALIMSGMPVQMNDHMALTHNGDCHVIAQKLMISLIAHNISLLKPKKSCKKWIWYWTKNEVIFLI